MLRSKHNYTYRFLLVLKMMIFTLLLDTKVNDYRKSKEICITQRDCDRIFNKSRMHTQIYVRTYVYVYKFLFSCSRNTLLSTKCVNASYTNTNE